MSSPRNSPIFTKYLAPISAIAIAGALLLSGQGAEAWGTGGISLDLTQRDFRVFNNFTMPTANDNQVADPQFPGYQGATLAIWKGAVEWGSLPHGDGSGDPTQPVIGSGGANFDPSFQGEATSIGGPDDNIHAQISGSNPGVLAYLANPPGNGWSIRYYENWNWDDGPGTVPAESWDLQGSACMMQGFAAGLLSSSVPGATLHPGNPDNGVSKRSIEADDIASLQFRYGVASGTKPVITGVTVNAGNINVQGTGFDSTSNELWFTQRFAGGDGTPIKVSGLASNGTTLVAPIPVNAGSGDVLVRLDGTSHGSLSNAWPVDLSNVGPPCVIQTYCTRLPNSTGFGASIGSQGTPSLTANDLVLTCAQLPPSIPGIYFYGNNQIDIPFGDGRLCTGGNITRLTVQGSNSSGMSNRALDLSAPPFDSGSGAAIAGSTKHFQFWYRDVAGGPAGFNTSDGLSVTFCN